MPLNELLAMSVADRTDHLEALLAGRYGLETAPGPKTESEVLQRLLCNHVKLTKASGDTLTKSLWARQFKAPLLLLKMLSLFHPHLLESGKPIRVLYLGADGEEFPDQGRWHALAWEMATGRPITDLEIVAVGPDLKTCHTWEPTPASWLSMVSHIPAFVQFRPGTLQEAMSADDMALDWEKYFDVVVMPHPGFVANIQQWLNDQAWADLAGFAEIPVMGSSYDPVDLAFDRNGLAVSGRIIDRVYWNSSAHVAPFHDLDSHHGTRIQWGGVMWSTIRDEDANEHTASKSQREALQWQDSKHFRLFTDTGNPIRQYLRWLYTCPMQFDDIHENLLVSDDIRIRCSDACVEAFGQTFQASDLSLSLISMTALDDRLALVSQLSRELAEQLDMDAVATAYANNVQRDNERIQGKGVLKEGVVNLLWADPAILGDIEVREAAIHGASYRSVPEISGAAMAFIEVNHGAIQIDGRDACANVAIASVIDPGASELKPGDAFLLDVAIDVEGRPGQSPERVARFIAMIITPQGVSHHKAYPFPRGGGIKGILSEVFADDGRQTHQACRTWGTSPDFTGNITVASIESVWIHSDYRCDEMVDELIDTACEVADFLSMVDAHIYPIVGLQTLTPDGRSTGMDPDLRNWLQGALVNLGASIPRPRAIAIGTSPSITRVLLPTPEDFLS